MRECVCESEWIVCIQSVCMCVGPEQYAVGVVWHMCACGVCIWHGVCACVWMWFVCMCVDVVCLHVLCVCACMCAGGACVAWCGYGMCVDIILMWWCACVHFQLMTSCQCVSMMCDVACVCEGVLILYYSVTLETSFLK